VIVHHQLALHGFWLLVWFLKSLKFFEKKFERIWFEFEKKSCFKRSLKKKRKKRKQTLLTFRPSQACRPTKPSRSGPPNRPPFLFFLCGRRHLGPACQPHPLPFFSSSPPRCPADPAPPRESRRAPPLPFLPSSPNRPIKAINPSLDQLELLPSFSTEP
jgi:hypothetical protein